jgi:hypothetical protein
VSLRRDLARRNKKVLTSHSERSEESLSLAQSIQEGFLAALGMAALHI